MKNIYALYLPPDLPGEMRASLGEVIQSDRRVSGWWNHLPGLYLLESDSDASALSKLVGKIVKPCSFLVMKIDPAELEGWMPDRGWPWIMSRLTEDKFSIETKALAE